MIYSCALTIRASERNSSYLSSIYWNSSVESSRGNCLLWKEHFWNIVDLLQYVRLAYDSHIPKPQGLNAFLKVWLYLELIKNEYLLPKLARFEDEMPNSDEDIGRFAGCSRRWIRKRGLHRSRDGFPRSIEDEFESELGRRNISSHSEKVDMPILHVVKCPACWWAGYFIPLIPLCNVRGSSTLFSYNWFI